MKPQGCGEELAEAGLLPEIVLGPVLSGVGDPHPRVRYAALACVGQMAEDFSEWDGAAGGDVDDDDDDESHDGSGSFQESFHEQVVFFWGVRMCMCPFPETTPNGSFSFLFFFFWYTSFSRFFPRKYFSFC